MKLSLVVLSEGKASGQSIPVKLSQFIIGRDPQCHLRPASSVISKRHCALITKDGKVYVRDFDSTNGTFVNEQQLKGQRELKNGDVLKLGPVVFRVEMEGAAAVDKPTPLPAARSGKGGEDDMAALMLMDDGAVEPVTDSETVESSIPSGTTEMNMPVMKSDAEKAADAKKEKNAKDDSKSKTEFATSSAAAASILAKYSRKQRHQ